MTILVYYALLSKESSGNNDSYFTMSEYDGRVGNN